MALDDFHGLAQADLESRGAQWTAREILQQPRVWRQVAELFTAEQASLQGWLGALLEDPALRIVLTGAGTSAFVGETLAPALSRHLDRSVEAVATTDIVSGPQRYLRSAQPTLLVSFARSGNSPESVAAIDLAQQGVSSLAHLVVTCNADGKLAARARTLPNARVLVLPEITNDRGFAMTSSFTSMVLLAALVFGATAPESVPMLAKAAEQLLQAMGPVTQRLAARRFERVVYLGSNELRGLAREAALKMLELTDGRVVALAESPLGFRHGPKTVIDARTLVVLMLANEPYVRAYDRDLLEELRRDARAGGLLVLNARSEDDPHDGEHMVLPAPASASDLEMALLHVLVAQGLALCQSLLLGLTPDNPNPAGVVNRVVQGVTIHPWPGHSHVPGR